MHLLLSTIALRPYVFIFLAIFLSIAIVNFGLRTTLLFTVLTYAVALACEWCSVHNGFPFGLYHYIDGDARPRDLGRSACRSWTRSRSPFSPLRATRSRCC